MGKHDEPVADSEWQQALGDVPRELFIPELIWVENEQADGYVAVCRSENPRRWGELVAADDAVVTQIDDGRTAPGSVGRSPSSSGSKPSIVADMLNALEVHPGHAVLEIGTGTGWNAALLSETRRKASTWCGYPRGSRWPGWWSRSGATVIRFISADHVGCGMRSSSRRPGDLAR